MYEKFFGFREKPFKLVPNPAYLFLSKSHEEALAHLNYALSQGDGFVEITGEVGTGKTTLCRTFLENLDETTIAAYIFNPKLRPKQLLKTINDELGITSDPDNTKDLLDKLNTFLIQKKTEHKKVILLIDEAQNLSRNVLEQLRLLSNLETYKEKLLQIILVGQPELTAILDSHDLRQLSQRITLRYHLAPLTYRETIEYIQYRIKIASQGMGIKFDRSALRRIFQYSRGIPRVINIACDRALLTAFGLNQKKITGKIVRNSIRELSNWRAAKRFDLMEGKKALMVFAALSIVLFVVVFYQPFSQGISSYFNPPQNKKLAASPSLDVDPVLSNVDPVLSNDSSRNQGPTIPEIAVVEETPPAQKTWLKLSDYMMTMDPPSSRYTALKYLMELWNSSVEFKPFLNNLDDDLSFFRFTAQPSGFSIQRLEADLDLIKRLNLPAIFEFYPPGKEAPAYLTLSEIDGDKITFGGGNENQVVQTDVAELPFYWSGIAYVPWKNFLSILGTIPLENNKDSIISLKILLHDLGYNHIELTENYDDSTRKAIEEIQAKYGIPVDGFVGPLTKIILYREKDTYGMPQLVK
jgi:general secretion pathway protein A